MSKRKYYKSKAAALKACEEMNNIAIHVYKMPKGSRHHGEYAVCSYVEFLNTY